MVMCFDFYPEAGSWLSSECVLLLVLFDLFGLPNFLKSQLLCQPDPDLHGIFGSHAK